MDNHKKERNREMKVIQVIDLFYPSDAYGGVLVAEKIVERLKSRFATNVVTTDLQSIAPIRRLEEKPKEYHNAKIYRALAFGFPKLLPIVSPGAFRILHSMIRKRDQSFLIHTHTYISFNSFFAAIFRKLNPHIRLVHEPYYHPFPGGSKLGYLVRRIYDYTIGRAILKSADTIILLSDAEKRSLLQIYSEENKMEVIPLGIRNLNTEFKESNVTPKFDFRKNDFVILCVSRIGSELLDFFIELAKSLDQKFIIILVGGLWGGQSKMGKVANKIHREGLSNRIFITGYISDKELRDYYLISDVFIKPSQFEAFGLVFVEAMSYGLPLMSYRVGALPEIIEEGENGFLFEKDDINAIAMKVTELQENEKLYKEISNRNREKAKQYKWDTILEKYIEIYEELAKDVEMSK